MIEESRNYRKNCGWFTSLVSKEKNLGKLTAKLKSTDIAEHRIIEMACRIIVQSGGDYSVLTPEEIDDLEVYVLGKKTK